MSDNLRAGLIISLKRSRACTAYLTLTSRLENLCFILKAELLEFGSYLKDTACDVSSPLTTAGN